MFVLAMALALAAPPPANETVRSMYELRANGDGVRARNPLTFAAEVSHHGLSGIGFNVWYQLTPNVAVDAGLGYSRALAKVGARLRYNFITDDFTPFVAAGISVGSGSFGKILEDSDPVLNARYAVGISPYAQVLAGVSYQEKSGFSLMAGLGWSHLLVRHNFSWQAAPLPKQREELPGRVGSGPLASIALGYAI